MLHDRYGLSVTTASNDARDAYVEGVDRILSANGGARESLEGAIATDPHFALAHAAYARWLQLAGRVADAKEAAARATELAETASARKDCATISWSCLFARGRERYAVSRALRPESRRNRSA